MPTPRLLRPVAALAAGALLATTLSTVLAGPAQADRADDGATWLESQLTGSLVHNDHFDFDDYGLTLDFGFGLRAIGGHRATVRAIRDEMADHVDSYTTGVDSGRPVRPPAASPSCAAYVQAHGRQTRATSEAPTSSSASTRRVAGDQPDRRPDPRQERRRRLRQHHRAVVRGPRARSSRLTQGRGGDQVPAAAAVRRRVFPVELRDAWTHRSRAATRRAASKKAPDTDATALAVLNLRAMPIDHRTARVRAAIADATAWLKKRQKRNGSLGGGTSTEGSNTNSTGLAAWALGDAGVCRPAARAARWVRDLQVVDANGTSLEGEDGAIAYDARRVRRGRGRRHQRRRARPVASGHRAGGPRAELPAGGELLMTRVGSVAAAALLAVAPASCRALRRSGSRCRLHRHRRHHGRRRPRQPARLAVADLRGERRR